MTNASIHEERTALSASENLKEGTSPILKLQHGKKSFGTTQVLKDISLEVHKGEVLGIIGPSGGGKSTLLRCLTLLEEFDAGSLAYEELDVCTSGFAENKDESVDASGCNLSISPAQYASFEVLGQARQRFGLVFQNFNLFPHYTVMQNIIDAPLCVQKRKREEVEQEAALLIEKMGLQGKEHMVPCELSGGQQQRVAIARALALKPKILFFDEPTSALDPELTKGVLNVIRDLAKENMTMVIVTHEMSFARDVADHIAFMEGGLIVEEGKAHDVIENPQNERTKQFLQGFE